MLCLSGYVSNLYFDVAIFTAREGNIFTGVFSVHRGPCMAKEGACLVNWGGGACMAQGSSGGEACVVRGDMHGKEGVCMAKGGGMQGKRACMVRGGMHSRRGMHGWYASYSNAFLFGFVLICIYFDADCSGGNIVFINNLKTKTHS